MDELLTTRQVAAELQVSESSVKRWCDQGMIRTQRTAGGHRRIQRSGLDAFLALSAAKGLHWEGRPAGPESHAAAPPTGSATRAAAGAATDQTATSLDRVAEAAESYHSTPWREQLIEQFQQALLAGDEAACRAVSEGWLSRWPSFAQLGDVLIAGAMDRIGRMWECGRAEVFQERRSGEICTRLVHALLQKIPEPGPRAPRAIGGTPAGDHYALASQLVELVLRDGGWKATNLGTNLPLDTLLAAASRERPRLLWLSISHIADRERFVEDYHRFYSQLPADMLVAVGGRALTDDLRPRIGFTAHCDNLEQLSALAQVISGAR